MNNASDSCHVTQYTLMVFKTYFVKKHVDFVGVILSQIRNQNECFGFPLSLYLSSYIVSNGLLDDCSTDIIFLLDM